LDSLTATVSEHLVSVRARLRDAGIPECDLEGELILQHVLGIDAAGMFASMNDTIRPGIEAELRSLTSRRASREPLAYITGRRGFYGRELSVTPDVLIPRQETELLVDLALRWVTSHPFKQSNVRIADIGTGSGALAVTLAAELGQSHVDAVDVSPSALNVAQQNALEHHVADRINFYEGDLITPLIGRTYDIVLANLPYVTANNLSSAQPEVLREPVLALLGGEDGMDLIKRSAKMLPAIMDRHRSFALYEIDPLTVAETVRILSMVLPTAQISVINDLAGLERCVTAELG